MNTLLQFQASPPTVKAVPSITLPSIELNTQLLDEINGAMILGGHFGASVQLPRFASLPANTRRGLATTLRRLANALADDLDHNTAVRAMLDALKRMQDNWDDEGAPSPSPNAISSATKVIDWAELHSLDIVDIDADVLGGVSARLRGLGDRVLWVACMNTSTSTAVWSEDGNVLGHESIDLDSLDCLSKFIHFLRAGDDKTS